MQDKSVKNMPEEKPCRKQIAFDLSDNALRSNYPRPRMNLNPQYYKKAWGDIANFMKENGFGHRQYSVYVSDKPLTDLAINVLMDKMARKMPWLDKCVEEIDVTNVGRQHSLKHVIHESTVKFVNEQSRLLNETRDTKETNGIQTQDDVQKKDENNKDMSMGDWRTAIDERRSKAGGEVHDIKNHANLDKCQSH